jgi:uncharacterized protein (TIGR00369 family)
MTNLEATRNPDGGDAAALLWATRLFAGLPVAGLLGARPLACDPQCGRMKVAFTASPQFCNLLGTILGGMLTAMLDLAMAFAALSTLEEGYAVPSLEVTTFIAPARPGDIVGEGTLIRRGRNIAFMEGRLTDLQGNLLAMASATAQIRLRVTQRIEPNNGR